MTENRIDKLLGGRGAWIAWISIIGTLCTGLLGLMLAVSARQVSDFVGAGVCAGASALSFGLLANAVLRQ